MAKSENKAVATQEKGGAVAIYDYSQFAGAGFENHTRDDYTIPFLGVLQSMSPQIETIAEAKPGMLINTVTNTVIDGKRGVAFVPAQTQHVFVEWKTRESGGGFVGLHNLDSDIVKKCRAEQQFGKLKLPNGNDLIETFYVYGVMITETSVEQAVIAFTSTKIKAYKRWMSRAHTIQVALPDGRRVPAPLFAHRYRLTTVKEKNNKGEFYNFVIEFDGVDANACRLGPDNEVFQQAVAFRELVQQGAAKAAYETQSTGGSAGGEEDADIPFDQEIK